MIKKMKLLIIILPILLNTSGYAEVSQSFDKEGKLSYSGLRTLLSESFCGDVNSVKDAPNGISLDKRKYRGEIPFNILTASARKAASEGNIEIFRTLYIANSHQKKDKILIPDIRSRGYLDLFYISLLQNGNICVLEKLMKQNVLLTARTRNEIFETALTIYEKTNGFKRKDKRKRGIYKSFMNRQFHHVGDTYQSRYKSVVLNEVTLPKHNFTAAEQAAFDEETARWMHFSF
jgi:hypothetical protein